MSIELEDTLFLQLTTQETCMVLTGLRLLTEEPGECYLRGFTPEHLASLADKLEEVIEAQGFLS